MKTWLTYLAAAAMGLAFELVFRDSAGFMQFMGFMTDMVMKLGMFIVFPLALVAMASGTASLTRKPGQNGFVWLSTIFWAMFTTAALSVSAALLFRLFPAAFPSTSSLPKSAEDAGILSNGLWQSTVQRLQEANPLSVNAFLNLFKSSDSLIPMILLALVFGYALRPTSEVVRPAYITLNSISEVMFRLAKKVAQLLWIAVFFISGTWFNTLWTDGTVFRSWRLVVQCCILGFGALLVVLPLVYGIATGFGRNPYRQITRLLSSGAASFFSVNYMFSQCTLYTDCRINLGIQKSVVGTALPLHSVLTKGGSAMVSTMCACALVYGINGAMPTTVQTITIALACTLASFVSSLHAGYEVMFVTYFALRLLDVQLNGAEFAIVALIPLLNGIALLFDVLLAGLGTSFTAYHLKADCYIRERDNV